MPLSFTRRAQTALTASLVLVVVVTATLVGAGVITLGKADYEDDTVAVPHDPPIALAEQGDHWRVDSLAVAANAKGVERVKSCDGNWDAFAVLAMSVSDSTDREAVLGCVSGEKITLRTVRTAEAVLLGKADIRATTAARLLLSAEWDSSQAGPALRSAMSSGSVFPAIAAAIREGSTDAPKTTTGPRWFLHEAIAGTTTEAGAGALLVYLAGSDPVDALTLYTTWAKRNADVLRKILTRLYGADAPRNDVVRWALDLAQLTSEERGTLVGGVLANESNDDMSEVAHRAMRLDDEGVRAATSMVLGHLVGENRFTGNQSAFAPDEDSIDSSDALPSVELHFATIVGIVMHSPSPRSALAAALWLQLLSEGASRHALEDCSWLYFTAVETPTLQEATRQMLSRYPGIYLTDGGKRDLR